MIIACAEGYFPERGRNNRCPKSDVLYASKNQLNVVFCRSNNYQLNF